MNRGKFDDIIKSRLADFEKAPPVGAFDKIKNRLEAEPKERVKPIFMLPSYVKYGMAASVAFLLGLFAMNTYWTNTLKNSEYVESNKVVLPSNNMLEIVVEKPTVSLSAKNKSKEVKLEEKLNASSSTNSTTAKSTNLAPVVQSYTAGSRINISSNPSSKSTEKFIFKSEKVPANNDVVYAQTKNTSSEKIALYSLANFKNEIDNGISLVKVNNEYGNTRFEITGSHLGYKGFWFGPNIGFSSRGISRYHFMGNGLGVDFGYDFTNKIGLQTGAGFNMLFKDFKLQDTDGKEYHELVNFSNVSLPLALKFKKSYFATKMERPVSFNTYIGMNYARMLKINKNDLGAHLGLEYDIFMRPDMIVTIGAKAGISSILDYSPSQTYLQANYKKFNYNLGIYASLRFISPNR